MNPTSDRIYRGVRRAAWGYLFLHLNLHLGALNLLPDFVGYLLLLQAIRLLEEEVRELALLRNLCTLLWLWTFADGILSWLGWSLEGHLYPLDLLIRVVGLYLHFQLLTNLAGLARRYQPEGRALDASLLRLRTVQLLLGTAAGVAVLLPPGDWKTGLILVLAVAGMGVALLLMLELFSLSKCLGRDQPTE